MDVVDDVENVYEEVDEGTYQVMVEFRAFKNVFLSFRKFATNEPQTSSSARMQKTGWTTDVTSSTRKSNSRKTESPKRRWLNSRLEVATSPR